MPDTDPHVLVMNGDERPPAPGAAAVFQGMLSVLGEELEGVHREVAALDRKAAAGWAELRAELRAESRADAQALAVAVADQVEQVVTARLAEMSSRLSPEALRAEVHQAVSGVEARIERLDALLAERAAAAGAAAEEALEGVKAEVSRSLADLQEQLGGARPAEPGLERVLLEVVPRLDALERALAGMEGLPGKVERLGRIGDGLSQLHDSLNRTRGETAAAVEGVKAAVVEGVSGLESSVGRRFGELGDVLPLLEELSRRQDSHVELAVRAAVADVDARLEQLQGSLGAAGTAWSASARALTDSTAAVVSGAMGGLADRVELLGAGLADQHRSLLEAMAAAGQAATSRWAAVESRLERLEAATGEGRAEAGAAALRLEGAAAATREHLVELEAGVRAVQEAPPFAARSVVENLSPAIEDVNDRVARLEQALTRLVDQADVRSTTLVSDLQGVLATGMERIVALSTRSEENTASELQGTRARVDAIAVSLADLAAEVASVAEAGRRLADDGRARPLLEAIDAASRENGEVLAALHASVTRRIDARVRSVAEMITALADPLASTSSLAPRLEEVGQALHGQRVLVERVSGVAEQLASAVAEVPGGLAGAFQRHEAALDQLRTTSLDRGGDNDALREAIAGMEASVGQALEGVRSYLGEGLVHVSRRQAGTARAMESAAAALQSMERQLNDLAGLCQSIVSGVDQQTGASARVADLVLETRSALRSDVDRLEATVHLEALKLHQQDQGRLAAAAAATGEVVEREAALLAQRVSSVAAAVESVRSLLHTRLDDPDRAGAAPLTLVREADL